MPQFKPFTVAGPGRPRILINGDQVECVGDVDGHTDRARVYFHYCRIADDDRFVDVEGTPDDVARTLAG